jgi:uncharacterized membrane-anchored protein YitT (DUF2179 family)
MNEFLTSLKIRRKRRQLIVDFLFILAGALMQAIALNMFLVPANLIAGGITGISQVINHYTGFPIGTMILIGNIPLFIIGWRYLGGFNFAIRTAWSVLAYSILTDVTSLFLPQHFTEDILLNALFGGVISGIGFGLVYRGRGTSGGSDIIARILNHYRGISISMSYLMTDTIVMMSGGFIFGWEKALYALVNLFVSGEAANGITTGSNIVRTVFIISDKPTEIAQSIMDQLNRGVTYVDVTGAYTGNQKTSLYTVVSRAEVERVKYIVQTVDKKAFVVVGQAQEVFGEGFLPLHDEHEEEQKTIES